MTCPSPHRSSLLQDTSKSESGIPSQRGYTAFFQTPCYRAESKKNPHNEKIRHGAEGKRLPAKFRWQNENAQAFRFA